MTKIVCPWDHVPEGNPETGVPNEPDALGVMLGKELARLTPQENCCHDCAFRLGTIPNQCSATLMSALKCVMEGDVFQCHISGKACKGWIAARLG